MKIKILYILQKVGKLISYLGINESIVSDIYSFIIIISLFKYKWIY